MRVLRRLLGLARARVTWAASLAAPLRWGLAFAVVFALLLAYGYFCIVVSERALRSYRALGPLFLGTLGWFGGFDPCARPAAVHGATGAADRLRVWRKDLQAQTRTLVEEMMPKLGIKEQHRIIPHARLRSNSQLAAELARRARPRGAARCCRCRANSKGGRACGSTTTPRPRPSSAGSRGARARARRTKQQG